MCLMRRICVFSTVFRLAMSGCVPVAFWLRCFPGCRASRCVDATPCLRPSAPLCCSDSTRSSGRRAGGLLAMIRAKYRCHRSCCPSASSRSPRSSTGLLISWPNKFLLVLYRPSNLRGDGEIELGKRPVHDVPDVAPTAVYAGYSEPAPSVGLVSSTFLGASSSTYAYCATCRISASE